MHAAWTSEYSLLRMQPRGWRYSLLVGAVAEGERLVEPLRRLGPVLDTVRPMTYCELQTMWMESTARPAELLEVELPARPERRYRREVDCVREGDALAHVVSHPRADPGVASRVPPDATAFPHRARIAAC